MERSGPAIGEQKAAASFGEEPREPLAGGREACFTLPDVVRLADNLREPVWPRRWTPIRLVVLAAAAVFIPEVIIMRLLAGAGVLADPLSTFLDAGILVVILVPPFAFGYLVLRRSYLERLSHVREMRALSRQLLTAVECERRKIARDLHDECGQSLAALQLGLQTLKQCEPDAPAEQREQCQRLVSLTTQLGTAIRGFAEHSLPDAVLGMGIIGALRSQILRISAQTPKPRIEFQPAGPDERLPSEIQTTLYRVCQEALNNALRHAQASLVRIRLVNAGGTVLLTVEDDGVGMELGRAVGADAAHQGLGLVGIRERVYAVGGRLDLTSRPGAGTTLRAEIPLPEAGRP